MNAGAYVLHDRMTYPLFAESAKPPHRPPRKAMRVIPRPSGAECRSATLQMLRLITLPSIQLVISTLAPASSMVVEPTYPNGVGRQILQP